MNQKGFATFEAILAVTIISVLAFIAVPKIDRVIDKIALDYEMKRLCSEIEFASSKRQDNGGGYEFGNENNSRPQNFNDGSDMIDNRNSKMPDDIDIPF